MEPNVRKLHVPGPTLLFGNSLIGPGFAQGSQTVTLSLRTENLVQYRYDVTNPIRIGKHPGFTPHGAVALFDPLADISYITEIKGKPARGSVVLRGMGIDIGRTAQSGSAIGDSQGRAAVYDAHFDILDDEGRPLGTMLTIGLGGGPAAPGLDGGFGSLAIIGGPTLSWALRGKSPSLVVVGPGKLS